MNIQILPSLLAADVGALGAEIARVARSGADALTVSVPPRPQRTRAGRLRSP